MRPASALERPPQGYIARKRSIQRDLFLAAAVDGVIAATRMAGYEGRRGWINDLAVDPSLQRRGIGRALLAEAELRLR